MSSSFASALRSVLGATLFNVQSLSLQARGSLLAHQRARRQRLSAQCRNDPSRSHCARRTKSERSSFDSAHQSFTVIRATWSRLCNGFSFSSDLGSNLTTHFRFPSPVLWWEGSFF